MHHALRINASRIAHRYAAHHRIANRRPDVLRLGVAAHRHLAHGDRTLRARPKATGRFARVRIYPLGFADALSHAGVKWLAASPETMVSPGVPSSVADAVAKNIGDSDEMGHAIVRDVMQQNYGAGTFAWKPAAAFDVLDLDPQKRAAVERSVKAFNDAVASRSADDKAVAMLRDDARSVQGMVRFSDATPDMPWHADRPAMALYAKIASDGRLDTQLRAAAANAESSVRALVTAHGESASFEPFGGSDYRDAVGPTVHFPVTEKSIDPWGPRITETRNTFFAETDAAAAERVLA
jgi:hypothetical protein